MPVATPSRSKFDLACFLLGSERFNLERQMTKVYAGVLCVLVLVLQYRIWWSDDGVSEAWRLRQAVAAQTATNEQLRQRNEQLAAEVTDLKGGLAAIEERARSELGMVAPTETFFQVVPKLIRPAPESVSERVVTPPRTAQR
jgi:cell division protein FtsB